MLGSSDKYLIVAKKERKRRTRLALHELYKLKLPSQSHSTWQFLVFLTFDEFAGSGMPVTSRASPSLTTPPMAKPSSQPVLASNICAHPTHSAATQCTWGWVASHSLPSVGRCTHTGLSVVRTCTTAAADHLSSLFVCHLFVFCFEWSNSTDSQSVAHSSQWSPDPFLPVEPPTLTWSVTIGHTNQRWVASSNPSFLSFLSQR